MTPKQVRTILTEVRESDPTTERYDDTTTLNDSEVDRCELLETEPTTEGVEVPVDGRFRKIAEALSLPLAGTAGSFWWQVILFWCVSLTAVFCAAAAMTGRWNSISYFAVGAAAYGVSAVLITLYAGGSRTKLSIFAVAGFAMLSSLMLLLVATGIVRALWYAPTWQTSLLAASTCWLVTCCLVSFASPVVAPSDTNMPLRGRLFGLCRQMATGWHRLAGGALLIVAYCIVAVPASAAIAASPSLMNRLVHRLAAKPSMFWLASLARITEMVAKTTGRFNPSTTRGIRGIMAKVARRFEAILAGFPMMIFGTWYTLMVAVARLLGDCTATPANEQE